MVMKDVDVHIASSFASFDAMNNILSTQKDCTGNAKLLLHGADERIYSLAQSGRENLSIVYFGSLKNTLWSSSISEHVSFVDATDSQSMQRNFQQLQSYSAHYCVRPLAEKNNLRAYKPFTKGIIAAHCDAPIIVNKGIDDVNYFVPDDYPYLLENADEESVLSTIEKIKKTFRAKEWDQALDTMRFIAGQTTPQALSQQFKAIIDGLS
jgi:hypothetical protein